MRTSILCEFNKLRRSKILFVALFGIVMILVIVAAQGFYAGGDTVYGMEPEWFLTGVQSLGTMYAISPVRFTARLFAAALGTYFSSAIASITLSFVFSFTSSGVLITRETVMLETPALWATSFSVLMYPTPPMIGQEMLALSFLLVIYSANFS